MDVGAIDVMVAQYLKERGHSVAFLAMLDDVENVTDAAVSISSAALFASTLQKMREGNTQVVLAMRAGKRTNAWCAQTQVAVVAVAGRLLSCTQSQYSGHAWASVVMGGRCVLCTIVCALSQSV
jgi:thioesterase domain-containing protein